MQYSLCSISFRHELISFRELIDLAAQTGFSGIELWGVHARAAALKEEVWLQAELEHMRGLGISISMISDYVDLLCSASEFAETKRKWMQLIEMAVAFGADKLRIFAGNKPSEEASAQEWEICVCRIKELTQIASQFGVCTLIETHPRTLANNLTSTAQLVRETEHPFLGINFDVLHIWEAGVDPTEAIMELHPKIFNVHLKNVRDAKHLEVFDPGNIYSPSGTRDGMTMLREGAIAFEPVLRRLQAMNTASFASLEWFGHRPSEYAASEIEWLKRIEQDTSP